MNKQAIVNIARKHIIALRKDRGLSLKDVAEAIGVSVGGYHNIEHGSGRIAVEHIAKLAQFYGVPPSEFFGEEHPGTSAEQSLPDDLKTFVRELYNDPDRFAHVLRLYRELECIPDEISGLLAKVLQKKIE